MEYIIIIPLIFMSIIIHEVSHGYVAYLLGDDTAKRRGRLSLNPLKHIDKFGTIILPVLLLLLSGGTFAFGYAKPVPLNPYNFKDFKRGTAYSAAAGPLANFIIAALLALLFRLFFHGLDASSVSAAQLILFKSLYIGIFFNLFLGLFNLIPIPPLDGSKVLGAFLSDEAYFRYTAQEQKGMMIFMMLMVVSYIFNLNIISRILMPPVSFIMKLLLGM
ncbi:MAG: site-2 protease family protein [Candidatus Cloacimonetes bacterium]|nr:site-2 protease family protein [Candidatus Cloacimonadota bacterium]